MMEELTINQKEALEELKKRIAADVPPHLKDDKYLYLRFLRARDFNLNLAENMLRNHLIWRKNNQIDNILTEFKSPDDVLGKGKRLADMSPTEERKARMGIVQKYVPLRRIGFDKDGNPVRYFSFGDMDAKGILKSAKRNDCIRAIIQGFEEDVVVMKEQSAKLGKPIEQWTYIFNFENYTFAKATHKPTLETLIALFMAYEANYPERLKAAYIINASIYFTIVFAVVKPLLSGATIQKITVFGRDGWKEELLKCIHAEDLPAFLGGTKTDPDGNPLCKTFVKHGEIVPEEYYLTKSCNRLSKQPGVQKLTVSRKSKANVILDVVMPGSSIEWEFETAARDIGFKLLYKTPNCDAAMKELVPNQRIDTQLISEAGMYRCEWPGTYILVFDNTYSWIHQKEIYYKAAVKNPEVENFGYS